MKKIIASIVALAVMAIPAFAQNSDLSESKPLESTVLQNGYPRILPDGTLLFRFVAPDVSTLAVNIEPGGVFPLEKDPEGVWTGRIKGVQPGYHNYTLVVDGFRVLDPASKQLFGSSGYRTMLEIPEEDMEVCEIRDVPHGQVREVLYFSKVTNTFRPLMVYTPAGYDGSDKRYPVVYIQHGGGEDYRGWMLQGKVFTIADNLIADGKAAGMILVCANGFLENVRTQGSYGSISSMEPFRKEMEDNIIPFVDATFRTVADRRHRALCGLSMGGGQAMIVGLNNLDSFANVGIFSTGAFGSVGGSSGNIEDTVPGILTRAADFNAQLDELMITCGEQDMRIKDTRRVVDQMRESGLKLDFNTYPGDHEWKVWRKSIRDFMQKLW